MVRAASLLAVLLSSLLAAGCIFSEKECPCGARTTDPIGEHDTSFSGSHVVDGMCLCTCGDDFPEAFDDNGDCSEHETACTDGDGNERIFLCD